MRGLPAGTYRVNFYDESGVYAAESWDGADLYFEATSIDLSAGAAQSGVNASMVEAGHIAGTVTGEGAGPLGDVWIGVNAFNGDWWEEVAWRYTLDGTYDIGGLAPGTYRLFSSSRSPACGPASGTSTRRVPTRASTSRSPPA